MRKKFQVYWAKLYFYTRKKQQPIIFVLLTP